MNHEEFLKELQNKKDVAIMLPAASERAIEIAQGSLMQMQCAMLPMDLMRFYMRHDGIICGDAQIFGVTEYNRDGRMYILPSIITVNKELMAYKVLRGKTVIGRNGLFWFAVDSSGVVWMLDVMTLSPVKKYASIYRAMYECLLVGLI